jgi:hypothetical protein
MWKQPLIVRGKHRYSNGDAVELVQFCPPQAAGMVEYSSFSGAVACNLRTHEATASKHTLEMQDEFGRTTFGTH